MQQCTEEQEGGEPMHDQQRDRNVVLDHERPHIFLMPTTITAAIISVNFRKGATEDGGQTSDDQGRSAL
jgi:hypothetical protein